MSRLYLLCVHSNDLSPVKPLTIIIIIIIIYNLSTGAYMSDRPSFGSVLDGQNILSSYTGWLGFY